MGIVTGEIDASFLNIEIGIVVEANVTLAFPPASLAFYGRLSGTSFEIRVRRVPSTSSLHERYLLLLLAALACLSCEPALPSAFLSGQPDTPFSGLLPGCLG